MRLHGLIVLGDRGRCFVERYVGRQRLLAGEVGRDVTVVNALRGRLDNFAPSLLPDGVVRGVVGGGPWVRGVFLRGINKEGKIFRGEGPMVNGVKLAEDPQELDWFRFCDDADACLEVAEEVVGLLDVNPEGERVKELSEAITGLLWHELGGVGAGKDDVSAAWRLARAAKELMMCIGRVEWEVIDGWLEEMCRWAEPAEKEVIDRLRLDVKGVKTIRIGRHH